jgi:protein-disulfide isomerase
MTFRPLLVALAVSTAVSCSGGPTEEPPAEPAAPMSNQELIALEATPGSSPALRGATEPAPAPVAGLAGAPGPSPAVGPAAAPVYVFVLTDFECPVCRRAVEPLKYLTRRYPKDVRLVIKHNALASHGQSAHLAAAAIAAFRQNKFWEFYDKVYSSPGGPYDDTTLSAYAQGLGLDVPRFQKDMTDPAVVAQVQYESDLANSIELRGTPAFVVNGTTQMGWGSYQGLASTVDRELERAKKLEATGVAANRVALEATRQSGPKGEQLAAALFPSS